MHSIFLARVEIVAISPVTKNCRAHRAIVPPGLEAGADRRREVADEWLLGVRRVSVTCEGTVRRLTGRLPRHGELSTTAWMLPIERRFTWVSGEPSTVCG